MGEAATFTRPFTSKGREERASAREADATQRLEEIARQIFNQTAPLRGQTVDALSRVLAGQRPSSLRVFAPEREALESQFRRARENVLSTTPTRGGQLNRSLVDLEIARAMGVSGLESDIRRTAFTQALGTGFGIPAVSIAGLGSAAGLFGATASRSLQETQGKNQSIGTLAGIGLCWIAARLYGQEDFQYARAWILECWEGRMADLARWAYRRWGQQVARRRSAVLLKPLFDLAVRRGRRAVGVI